MNDSVTPSRLECLKAFLKTPSGTFLAGIILLLLLPGLIIIPINLVAALISIAVFVIALIGLVCRKRRRKGERREQDKVDVESQYSLQDVTDLPKRFSYHDLEIATNNFKGRLGGGGFGSVFEGVLVDGARIAVKQLDQFGQGEKEFLAEVKTIGSVHHVNLAGLVGFCAENSRRLLVYEYMSNGSLDKWIFNVTNPETALRWRIRKKIILSIAKGLAYLHEDCKMRIAHLDVKPQNILLDYSFNARLSDFGLARLIDRNQSQVITQMRGTRGYMAPEWLSGKITEKADVYSFGVVILEIVCGRKNLDLSQTDEDHFWLSMLAQSKAEENRLVDLVDKCGDDMQSVQHVKEAVEMIKTALRCLDHEPSRRPSMSILVKVFEDVMSLDPVKDLRLEIPTDMMIMSSYRQAESLLSGPR